MFTPQFKYGALLSPRQVGDELYMSRRSQHTSDSLSCFRFHSFPADVKPDGLVRLLKYDKKPASHRSSYIHSCPVCNPTPVNLTLTTSHSTGLA